MERRKNGGLGVVDVRPSNFTSGGFAQRLAAKGKSQRHLSCFPLLIDIYARLECWLCSSYCRKCVSGPYLGGVVVRSLDGGLVIQNSVYSASMRSATLKSGAHTHAAWSECCSWLSRIRFMYLASSVYIISTFVGSLVLLPS